MDARIRRGHTHYSLLGYQLDNGHYEPLSPNDQGWLWLPPVRVWLGLRNNWLICYDVNEQPIGDYVQVVQEREIAQAKAEQAQQRALQAEERAEEERRVRLSLEEQLKQSEAELRRLRQQT